METKIVKIHRADKDKNDKPYMTKDNRPYTRVGIQVDDKQFEGRWLSGFGNSVNALWKIGDTIEIEVEPKGDYLNFKTPNEQDKIWKELNRQAGEIVNLKKAVADFLNHNEPQQDDQDDFGKEGDLPF